MIWSDEQSKVNERVDKEVYDTNTAWRVRPSVKGLISEILNYDQAVVKVAMGEVGLHLHAFASIADLQHPDLSDVAESRLQGTLFGDTALELLALADYSFRQKFVHVCGHFPKILSKMEDYGFISLRVTDPSKNACQVVRFIKDPETRHQIRMRRTSQDMSLFSFYTKKKDTWESLPESFLGFVRNKNPFGNDIDRLKRRVVHFEELGLESNAAKMRERLELLDTATKEQYYGFNRCPVSTAAIILAKVNGFHMSANGTRLINKEHKLRVCDDAIKRIKESGMIDVIHSVGGSEYQPRLYASVSMTKIPVRMSKLMNHLDSFPVAGGKPIFDHFGVLMPSLSRGDSPIGAEVPPRCRDMDSRLVENNVFTPILLGERDGKQYFIDYWN